MCKLFIPNVQLARKNYVKDGCNSLFDCGWADVADVKCCSSKIMKNLWGKKISFYMNFEQQTQKIPEFARVYRKLRVQTFTLFYNTIKFPHNGTGLEVISE